MQSSQVGGSWHPPWFGAMVFFALLGAGQIGAQGLAGNSPIALRFAPEYAVPVLHQWYGARHLPEIYDQAWYEGSTFYAQESYTRYVRRQLEGRELYDVLGNSLGRGWQIYSWTQQQPQARGSLIDKDRNLARSAGTASLGFRAYDNFFKRLVIASDQSGEQSYRLMVGDEIWTLFSPLTFYKPRFNGVRLDYAADRVAASLLLSRPSDPDDKERTNITSFLGGHTVFQLADWAGLGLTYVNAHTVQTQVEFDEGNPLHGILSPEQNQPLDKFWVRIRDDSPGEGTVGPRLADYDIVLVDTSGRQLRGSEINLLPKVEGGLSQGGRLEARDAEVILLEYDLAGLDFEDIQSEDLRRVGVELAIANDFRIELASNLQTDGKDFNPEIVFLPVRRASGNVQDNSNTQVVRVDYGLPVANEIFGFDWQVVDWLGLYGQGELALNRRFSRYPNPNISKHYQSVQQARAGYVQAAWDADPYLIYAEAFSIADDYSTSYWLTDANGRLAYKSPIPQVYEFVDDDDDRDSWPEWQRPFQGWQRTAWPGYDENRDFINDFNQNNSPNSPSLIPDYDEPFLRYRSDRPQFLFGLDLNHNGTIDRFENDDRPDYPYRRDHRGFNTYVQGRVGPDMRLLLGRQDMRLIAGDGHTRAWYGLATWEHSLGRAQLRLFDHAAWVEDTIADDLTLWFQPVGAPGSMRQVRDLLPAQNTWKNVLYADLAHRLGPDFRFLHRFKWEGWWQRQKAEFLRGREGRQRSGFFGLIDKAEWSLPIGLGVLEPRWKSEYRRQRPFSTRLPVATSLEQTAFILWTQPLLAEQVGVSYFPRYGRQLFNTELQVGLELTRFWLLQGRYEEIDQDFSAWTGVVQLTNHTAYLGYRMTTRCGLQFTRRHFDRRASQRNSQLFLSILAGLE